MVFQLWDNKLLLEPLPDLPVANHVRCCCPEGTCEAGEHEDCHVVVYPPNVDVVIPAGFTDGAFEPPVGSGGCQNCDEDLVGTFTLDNNTTHTYICDTSPDCDPLNPFTVLNAPQDYVYWYTESEWCTIVRVFTFVVDLEIGLALYCTDGLVCRLLGQIRVIHDSSQHGNPTGDNCQVFEYEKITSAADPIDLANDTIELDFVRECASYELCLTPPATITVQPT